jgi:tRNA (guanine37-N1)-methyltransferase
VRILPGVVGEPATLAEESFESGLLEYPHYTRPQVWEGRAVPEILLSGHHENNRAWRRARAEEATRTRRPDLWERYVAATARRPD